MATYFIRQSGSDSNAGTSAGAAWRTIGKALGASGMGSGDTAYIGAGVYREAFTVAMTNPGAETKIIADVDGVQTGDAGEVIWTAYIGSDWAVPHNQPCLNLAGRDFLTFEKITFVAGIGDPGIINANTTAGSNNITFRDCYFSNVRTANSHVVAIKVVSNFAEASNWTIERCRFLAYGTSSIQVELTTGTGSDYDSNFQIKDCLFFGLFGGSVAAIFITSVATNANEGGGVDITGCSVIGGALMVASGTRVGGAAFTFPCTVQNNLVLCGGIATGIAAGETGAVVDNGYNRVIGTATFSNVTAHVTSEVNSFPPMLIHAGHEQVVGSALQPFGTPYAGFPLLGWGPTSSTVDLTGKPRPSGDSTIAVMGTATGATSSTLSDSGKSWGTDQWKGWFVRIVSGTGAGQVKRVHTNTGTQLTITGGSSTGGNWATTPSTDSVYMIYQGPLAETGKSTTTGSTTTLTDAQANWATNMWAGHVLNFTGGTGSGQTATVSSNTGTVLTFNTQSTAPDSTTTYSLYISGSIDDPQPSVGALERHDTARKETTVTDAAPSGIFVFGKGNHEFHIPVDATSTTISIKARYDSNHGTANKPRVILLANGEIGVTTETKTMTSSADTWETLTFAAQTPSAKGIVTIRVEARSAKSIGFAYFDTVVVA